MLIITVMEIKTMKLYQYSRIVWDKLPLCQKSCSNRCPYDAAWDWSKLRPKTIITNDLLDLDWRKLGQPYVICWLFLTFLTSIIKKTLLTVMIMRHLQPFCQIKWTFLWSCYFWVKRWPENRWNYGSFHGKQADILECCRLSNIFISEACCCVSSLLTAVFSVALRKSRCLKLTPLFDPP